MARRRWSPVVLVALLALLARPAAGSQVRLGWGDSPANGGATGIVFDCFSDEGEHAIVVTFVPDQDLTGVTGWRVELATFEASSAGCDPFAATGECGPYSLPGWWDFSATGCRQGAARTDLDFGVPPFVSSTTVTDPWQGRAALAPGSGVWTIETRLSTSLGHRHYTLGRCTLDAALPAGESVTLRAGHEVYVARIVIDDRASAGPDACFGCCTPVVVFAGGAMRCGDATVSAPTSAPLRWLGDLGCAPVPVRGSTWGRLKSVYR